MFPTSLKRASLLGCIQGASSTHLGRNGAQKRAAPKSHSASLLSPLEVTCVQLCVKEEPALKEFGCCPVGLGSEWHAKAPGFPKIKLVHGTSSETGCAPQPCDTPVSFRGPSILPSAQGWTPCHPLSSLCSTTIGKLWVSEADISAG